MQVANTPGFKAYFVDSEYFRAYEDLKGYSINFIINSAKAGNLKAINAIYYILYPTLYKIYTKYYLESIFEKDSQKEGKDYEFLSKAYIFLFNSSPKSFLYTYEPPLGKSEKSSIKDMLYVSAIYLKHMITGKSISSSDLDGKSILMDSLNLHLFTTDVGIQHAFIDFLDFLSQNDQNEEYNLLLLRAKGYPDEYILHQLNLNPSIYYRLLKSAKDKFKSFIGV